MRWINIILVGILGLAAGCATIYLGALLILSLTIWLSTYVPVPPGILWVLLLPIFLAGGVLVFCLKKTRHTENLEAKRRYLAFIITYAVSTVLTIMFWLYLVYYIMPKLIGPEL